MGPERVSTTTTDLIGQDEQLVSFTFTLFHFIFCVLFWISWIIGSSLTIVNQIPSVDFSLGVGKTQGYTVGTTI